MPSFINSVSIVRGVFCPGVLSEGLFMSGRFCPGWILSVPVLSEYICYIRKLNITLNFMFRMYDNFFISVTSHSLFPPHPVTNCHTRLQRKLIELESG